MTTTYVNVGVGQVQTWLNRSPDLAGRRGASSLLAQHTGREAIETLLADRPGVGWNEEAGEVSGIAAIRIDGDDDPADVARLVLDQLRQHLPAANLTASWATGSSYIEAYPRMARMQASPDALVSRPAMVEHVVARRCNRCGVDPAVALVILAGRRKYEVCRDCQQRYDARGYGGRRAANLRPYYERLQNEVQDLQSLARLNRWPAGEGEGTRVAVFYADGNAVGRFIGDVLEGAEAHGTAKAMIVEAISEANDSAFYAAAEAVAANVGWAAVIPHLIAGDDILVSVPASEAWVFATTALATFNDEMRRRGEDLLGEGAAVPTLSGALVFHHASSPLSEAIILAGDLLRRVKDHSGATSALGYLDLMRDDPDINAHRVRDLEWVHGQRTSVEAMAAKPRSHRSRLRTLAAQEKWDGFRDTVRREGGDLPESLLVPIEPSAADPQPSLLDRRPDDGWVDAALWLLAQCEDLPPPTGEDAR